MYLLLHKLGIHLQSEHTVIRDHWQHLFHQWFQESLSVIDIVFRLQWVEALPTLPQAALLFSDSQSLPDDVGLLSVYQAMGEDVWLHFRSGALVKVPLYKESPQDNTPIVSGVMTKQALTYGRFEDITLTSLAPLLRRRGYYLIHAFAVQKNGRAILIVGPSGSGKTTAGLSFCLNGWDLLANDAVLLESRTDGVYALPTPGGIGLRAPTCTLLPGLRPLVDDAPLFDNKYYIERTRLLDGRRPQPARVTMIYLPHVAHQANHHLQKQTQALCLAHLMAESMDRWDPSKFSAHLTLLQQMCQQAPAYILHLGHNMGQLPQWLSEQMSL